VLPKACSSYPGILFDDENQQAIVIDPKPRTDDERFRARATSAGGMTQVTYDISVLRPGEVLVISEWLFVASFTTHDKWKEALETANHELLYEHAAAVPGCLGACVIHATVWSRTGRKTRKTIDLLWLEKTNIERALKDVVREAWKAAEPEKRYLISRRLIQRGEDRTPTKVGHDQDAWLEIVQKGDWHIDEARLPAWGLNGRPESFSESFVRWWHSRSESA